MRFPVLKTYWGFGVSDDFFFATPPPHLAAISAGKYLTITRSPTRDSYLKKKNVLLTIIFAPWTYSFGFSVAPSVGWSKYGLEGTDVACMLS